MLLGYARVSTKDQDLTIQREALEKAGWISVPSPGMLIGGCVNNAQLLFSMRCREEDIIVVAALQ